jgi:uncharacterized protein (TIGR03437 family)
VNLSIWGQTGVRLAMTVFVLTPVLCLAQVKVPPGTITTIAGDNIEGYLGDAGPATSAELSLPFYAVFVGGNLYIADQFNNVVRFVAGGNGNISTIAGTGTSGFTNDGIKATVSDLASPTGLAVDGSGNLYIADTLNSAIRKVTAGTGIISTFAGNEQLGYGGDGSGALSAMLSHPSSILFDSSGNMFIADSGNNVIRKVIASSGNITTYAGNFNTPGYTGDGGPATRAGLMNPVAIAMDAGGNLYIADTSNNVVRKVATNGIITTIAGNGTPGFAGDGGRAVFAQLSHPKGVAVDAAGDVYISDTFNSRIRMVTPNGTISTVIGTGAATYSGDGGLATAATLSFPAGLSFDTAGNLYIADNNNNVIREYAPPSAGGGGPLPVISTGGVISASSFGAFPAIAPGTWIEIYGSNLAATTANWNNSFTGVNAPTSLAGTTVSIGGLSAFVDFVSPGQVNAQVPSGTSSGSQQIVVATAAGQSAASTITINGTEPGLWAPAMFLLGGKQYVGAQLTDGNWALPAGTVVPNVPSRPAHVGDVITIYGVGFGPVSPATPAGQIVQNLNSLIAPLAVFFGPAQATLSYYGLAPGLVGVYQFNMAVPNVASSNAVPVTFVLGSSSNLQTLYTAVQ